MSLIVCTTGVAILRLFIRDAPLFHHTPYAKPVFFAFDFVLNFVAVVDNGEEVGGCCAGDIVACPPAGKAVEVCKSVYAAVVPAGRACIKAVVVGAGTQRVDPIPSAL